jgi:tetratricopeptide (TPR) repeat protein
MGSKLVHVAQVIALLAATPAFADPSSDELIKQAGEAYKVGKYDDAAAALEKAYAIDHKPDTLFALAQAERLGGRCKDAIPHYKQVLEKMNDLNVAKLVQTNLSLCERERGTDQPAKPDGPAAPQVVTRVERHTDKLAVTLFATGTLGIGAGVGFYISSVGNADAAKTARTLDDNTRLNDRADTQRVIALAAGGVGLALAGYAIVRWMGGKSESSSKVAIVPGPGSLGVFARF